MLLKNICLMSIKYNMEADTKMVADFECKTQKYEKSLNLYMVCNYIKLTTNS